MATGSYRLSVVGFSLLGLDQILLLLLFVNTITFRLFDLFWKYLVLHQLMHLAGIAINAYILHCFL